MPLSENVISEPAKTPLFTAPFAAPARDRECRGTRATGNGQASASFPSGDGFCPPGLTGGTREAGGAGGLVPSLTSDTRQSGGRYRLDPKAIRHKRLYRSVKTSARLHEQEMAASGFRFNAWFVTLTYAPGVEWEPLHITKALKAVRSWCARLNVPFRYVWVAEVQAYRQLREGGHCLHYHLLVFLPRHINLPKFDKRGWWPHGLTQTVKAVKPVSYMAKYASKGCSCSVPKGARLHGCGGLSHASRWNRTWWLCPAYVRDYWPEPALRPIRAKGGGWLSKATGEFLPSLYAIISFNPLVVVCKSFVGLDSP